tara:strand:+ start:878 stop:1021 length:144 start_codon:yes stop_codon:yes gene_type:complete
MKRFKTVGVALAAEKRKDYSPPRRAEALRATPRKALNCRCGFSRKKA